VLRYAVSCPAQQIVD